MMLRTVPTLSTGKTKTPLNRGAQQGAGADRDNLRGFALRTEGARNLYRLLLNSNVKRQETLLKFQNGIISEIDFSKWDLQT